MSRGVWGALVVLVACDAGGAAARDDAAQPSQAADAPAAEAQLLEEPDATIFVDAAPTEAATADDQAWTYPPPMTCDMDASAGASITMCPPPISVCNSPTPTSSGNGIYYFDWGQCEAGWCNWPRHLTPCPYSGLCYNGGCEAPPTM
jgi:hypothetical protein